MTTQRYERIPEWTLGDRLRKARMTTGLNTSAFAEHLGVSQKTVNNAESDKHSVRKIVLNAWSLATGVPVEWLVDGTLPDDGGGPEGGDYASSPERSTLVRSYRRLHLSTAA